ncbi:MAG: YraN family protein [Imperialibacter sp.]|uniref:YraN family protein n=1 Tax=Imperialibacter sp. TaxID=2038411 RepID=UPI0032EF7119
MPAKSHNQSVGKKGEIIATDHLRKAGYEIIAKNYRAGRGEIDIIAKLSATLIFVEVKTRSNGKFGYPEEAVTQKKADKLIETAQAYMEEVNWEGNIRFDIISVDLQRSAEITHFEDAFH